MQKEKVKRSTSKKKKFSKEQNSRGVGMWFSPMFKKTTKVKLPCIVLSFTAVVNKERLIKIQSDLTQWRALENNARTATQSRSPDGNRCVRFRPTHDWRLHKTASFLHLKSSKRGIWCKVFRELSRAMLPPSLQCRNHITEQQHCENGMFCIAFHTHCLEEDLRCISVHRVDWLKGQWHYYNRRATLDTKILLVGEMFVILYFTFQAHSLDFPHNIYRIKHLSLKL